MRGGGTLYVVRLRGMVVVVDYVAVAAAAGMDLILVGSHWKGGGLVLWDGGVVLGGHGWDGECFGSTGSQVGYSSHEIGGQQGSSSGKDILVVLVLEGLESAGCEHVHAIGIAISVVVDGGFW